MAVRKTDVGCPDDMVLIPAGSFGMGESQKEDAPAGAPLFTATLSSYCLDRYELPTAGARPS